MEPLDRHNLWRKMEEKIFSLSQRLLEATQRGRGKTTRTPFPLHFRSIVGPLGVCWPPRSVHDPAPSSCTHPSQSPRVQSSLHFLMLSSSHYPSSGAGRAPRSELRGDGPHFHFLPAPLPLSLLSSGGSAFTNSFQQFSQVTGGF